MPADPLILTLHLDAATFGVLDTLRQTHFPPSRNLVPAHITLFHDLPSDEDIAGELAAVCSETADFAVSFPKVRFLGRGVAVEVASPELVRVRARLADVWGRWLTPQDRQPYRPHVTVQNKVTAAEARTLYANLSATWSPFDGRGTGLQLWHYRGGPWESAGDFAFP